MIDCLKPLSAFHDRTYHVHARDGRVDRHRLDEVGILATLLEFHAPKLPGEPCRWVARKEGTWTMH
jgi:hypothetical protein